MLLSRVKRIQLKQEDHMIPSIVAFLVTLNFNLAFAEQSRSQILTCKSYNAEANKNEIEKFILSAPDGLNSYVLVTIDNEMSSPTNEIAFQLKSIENGILVNQYKYISNLSELTISEYTSPSRGGCGRGDCFTSGRKSYSAKLLTGLGVEYVFSCF